MTAAGWETCTALDRILEHLYATGCERKIRLFAVACCLRIRHLIVNREEDSRQSIWVAERFADPAATPEQLHDACSVAYGCCQKFELVEDELIRQVTLAGPLASPALVRRPPAPWTDPRRRP